MKSFFLKTLYSILCLSLGMSFLPKELAAQGVVTVASGSIAVTGGTIETPGVVTAINQNLGPTSLVGKNTTTTAKRSLREAVIEALEETAYQYTRNLSKKLIAMSFAELQGGASGFDHPERFISDFAQLGNDLVVQETQVFTDALIAKHQNSDTLYGAMIGTMIINSGVTTGLSALNTTINKIPGVDPVYASRNIGSAGVAGWDFYSQLALPQNTPVGSAQISREILAQNIRNAQTIKQQEISSSGYAPARQACDTDFNSNQNAPIIADLLAQVQAAKAGYDVAVADGGGVPTQAQQAIINDNKQDLDLAQAAYDKAVQDQKNINTEFGLGCANAVITNPKGAIESVAQQAIAAPFADLEKENKWYTILSEAIQQVATGLINYGVSKIPANNIFNFN